MKRNVELSASLICIDWLRVGEQLETLQRCGVHRLHVDIMDGRMAKDFGISIPILKKVREVFWGAFDYHVMCENAAPLLPLLPQAPGDTLCMHLQQGKDAAADLSTIRNLGFHPGLSVSASEDLNSYSKYLHLVDILTLVAVPLGSIGAKGNPAVGAMVSALAAWRQTHRRSFQIVADGNITPAKAAELTAAGADILVGGSTGIFRSSMLLAPSIRQMQSAISLGLSQGSSHEDPGFWSPLEVA